MKYYENWPGTMKTMKTDVEPWKIMENQPGTMNNQPRTMKNHENRPGTMKNQPGRNKQKRYKQTEPSYYI